MTDSFGGFTSTDLILAASRALTTGGYRQIRRGFPEWDTPTARLFEDEYNIVGLVVFETCGDLLQAWPDLQGSLVDVISRHVGSGESKSWDGYLVLLTTAVAPSDSADIESIRYNTTRLRKIVATGEDLWAATDVERVLRSLLPLGEEHAKLSQESVLDLLPRLLTKEGISNQTIRVLVEAFRKQAPLLERLHEQQEAP